MKIKTLICLVDKKTNEKSKTRPRFIKQDQIAIVRFEAHHPICMETFKDHPQLGRFTLRDEGELLSKYFIKSILIVLLFRHNDCHRKNSESSGLN